MIGLPFVRITVWLVIPLTGLLLLTRQAPSHAQDLPEGNTVAPLEPREARSDEDRDLIEARALIAAGRVHQLRGENLRALKCFQEAYFWNPQARLALPEIVTLAAAVGRTEEALRYAQLAVNREVIDDAHLQLQLASLLAQEGKLDTAVQLYRKTVQRHGADERDADFLLASFELGRLSFLLGLPHEAGPALLPVWQWLGEPPADAGEALRALREQMQQQTSLVYELLFEAFLASSLSDAAEQVLQKLDALPDSADAQALRRARLAWSRGEQQTAWKFMEQYLASETPQLDPAAFDLLTQWHSRQHADDRDDGTATADPPSRSTIATVVQPSAELLKHLRQLHEQRPDDVGVTIYLAKCLRDAGDSAESTRLLREAVDREPSLAAYQGLVEAFATGRQTTELTEILLEVYQRAGDPQLLGPIWQVVADDEPLARGVVRQLQERLEHAASEELTEQQLLECRALGLMLAVELEPLVALQPWWQPLLEGTGEESLAMLVDISSRLIERQAYGEAVELLRALSERATSDLQPLVYYYLSSALAAQEDYDDALAAAQQAVSRASDPLKPLLELRVAWVLLRAGRDAESEALYLRLLQRAEQGNAETDWEEVVREARMLLSGIYLKQDKVQAAERLLVEQLMQDPEDSTAANDLAYLWVERGRRLVRSLQMLQEVVDREPDNAAFRDSLGWAYYQRGEYQQAVNHLRLATAGDVPDPVILEHLGDALWKVGEAAEARTCWQRAAEAQRSAGSHDKAEAIENKVRSFLAE